MLSKTHNFLFASLLVTLNKGINLKKKTFTHKSSNFLINILKQFQKLSLISGFCRKNDLLYIYLKYDSFGNSVIRKVNLMSKPGSKIYLNLFNIKQLKKDDPSSFYLLSTNKGLVDINQALNQKVGGKLLCKIWL